jgi:hypothetical protein
MGDGEYRKSVGRSSNGGGGAAVDASPSGDHRLAGQIRAAWNKGKPNAQETKANLFFDDAKQAVIAIRKKEVSEASAPQIAYNLGLIQNSMDTTARDAMTILTNTMLDRPATVESEHDRLIREASEELDADDSDAAESKPVKKRAMSPEEWKAEVENRRNRVKKTQATKLRLIPAQSSSGPTALTGNGINEPNQGAGQDEADDAPLKRQTDQANRASDAWQTNSGNEPAVDGHNAPSRHSALEKVKRLQQELEAAKVEAASEMGVESVIGRLRTASLTPDQIDGLHAYLDQFDNKDLYSTAKLDSVVSGLGESFEEVVTDADIAEYLNKTGKIE